jgi:hypothetical protein
MGQKPTSHRGPKSDFDCFGSKSGQTQAQSVCPLCADFVAKVGDGKSVATASMS